MESELDNLLDKKFSEKDLLSMDKDELNKINEELIDFKKKQQIEIDNLKKELNGLKNENQELDEYINNDNNINLNQQVFDDLKETIIKKVSKTIDEYKTIINDKLSQIEKDINSEYKKKKDKESEEEMQKEIINLNDNVNHYIQNKKEDKQKANRKVMVKQKNGNFHQFNISTVKVNNSINTQIKHKNYINDIKIAEDNSNIDNSQDWQNINEDNINNINENYNHALNINNFNAHKNSHYFQKDYYNNNNKYGLFNNKMNKNMPLKMNQALQQPPNIYQKKEPKENLFTFFNDIFFHNKEQTIIKEERINELCQKNIQLKFYKYKRENNEKFLIDFFDNFLKTNVFKIFNRTNEKTYSKEIIKYNIEIILKCFGLDKNTYIYYYYQNGMGRDVRNRKRSTEAAIKFRKTFNIGKNIIKEEELIKRLDQNDNDINKVFQQMYG